MGNVCPFVTNDGSVGLFSEEFDDIYHSVTGAYTEACEKFIEPADTSYYYLQNKDLKVLDLCYGIGYNTKSLLQNYFDFIKNNSKKIIYKKKHIETIHSDNILYNKIPKLTIDAVDLDKNLIILSPFFKIFKKYDLQSQYIPNERIKKYFANQVIQKYQYSNYINFVILEELIKSGYFDKEMAELATNYKNNDFKKYFDLTIPSYMRFLYFKRYGNTLLGFLSAFVHNIYYHHISNSNKIVKKALNNGLLKICFCLTDARDFVKSSNNKYDLIFLDAFTTNKCPCLWTYDFFKILYEHLSSDGKIITYSNAAHVRNAMLMAGFHVGKIFNNRENKFTGTIAVKNKAFIKYELTESDLSLVKSKTGIVYRDENLSALNETILKRRELEIQNSDLISASQLIKNHKKKAGVNV